MDGARDIFWIKSLNGTFLALQIKAFGPKKFWFSCMGKKVPFWQFLKILGLYNFLAYLECFRSYAWSKGHSDPDLNSVTSAYVIYEWFQRIFMSIPCSHVFHGGCHDLFLIGVDSYCPLCEPDPNLPLNMPKVIEIFTSKRNYYPI